MTESRDAETDLHRKFNELANIDMSDVHYDDSEQTYALGDADKFKLAQRQCKTLEHLWTRARTGSSELKIIGGLLYQLREQQQRQQANLLSEYTDDFSDTTDKCDFVRNTTRMTNDRPIWKEQTIRTHVWDRTIT